MNSNLTNSYEIINKIDYKNYLKKILMKIKKKKLLIKIILK